MLLQFNSDLRRQVFGFLNPNEFQNIRILHKMSTSDISDIYACVSKYKLTNIETFYRFRRYVLPEFLMSLTINCNHTYFMDEIEYMTFPNLRYLNFYREYQFLSYEFPWRKFFKKCEMRSLKEISWHHLEFNFLEMKDILQENHYSQEIIRLKITPKNGIFTSFDFHDNSFRKTGELVELYKSLPNLQEMRLDYEEKYADGHYMKMFQTSLDFSNLKKLQLMNRSKMLVQQICSKNYILPNLETLDIMWLFDTDDFMFNYGTFMNQFMLKIYKSHLQELKLSFMSWGNIFRDFICSICLYSESCVTITTKDVRILVIDCPNGYVDNFEYM